MDVSKLAAVTFAALLLAVAGAPVAAAHGSGTPTATAPGAGTSTPVDCTFPVTSTDATGTNATVEERPERIVAVGASAAQTLWAINASDRVVGMPVGNSTAYLNGSQNRTEVTDARGYPVAETVVAQNPDLVLAPNIVDNDTVQSLREDGLTVYRFEAATSVGDVTRKTRLIGRLVGNYEEAATVSARTEGRTTQIRSAVADEDRPRVYYALGGGWTVDEGSFIHDVITAAGGQNVAAGHLNGSYGTLSREIIASEDPEYIVHSSSVAAPSGAPFDETTAVREDQVISVDANYINQPGPRVVTPLEQLAGAFHADAYATIDDEPAEPAAVPRCAGANGAAEPDGTNGTDDGSTSAPGPGFGAIAAVLALSLAGALLVARRRI